jgi:hypothetical protein
MPVNLGVTDTFPARFCGFVTIEVAFSGDNAFAPMAP